MSTQAPSMASNKAPGSSPHDETVVVMLKADPAMADVYLATALEETDLPGGQFALLDALRHIAEAQGMGAVAEKTGMQCGVTRTEQHS